MTKHQTYLDGETPLIEMQKMPTGGASDVTLKADIKDISGLSTLLKLRPVTWRWVAKQDARREYGFVAQEVEEVLPQLVSEHTWEDGSDRKLLSTKEMVPLLVAALREQQGQIRELRELVNKTKL